MFLSFNWTASPVLLGFIVVFALVVFVQLGFLLGILARLAFHKIDSEIPERRAPVSVVVCAHNEFENLQELLPLLQAQNYPQFEIIVVNDRSTDDTQQLAEQKYDVPVRFIHVEQTYDHVTPKKYAITTAIRQAKHELILLTDADCRPNSPDWITHMAAPVGQGVGIVLGFSPYYKESGFLNRLIRFETFYAAVQYLSFALAGWPYMGVGRNLLYKKSLFLANKGFYRHLRIMGGDDDLLINDIANAQNTRLCLQPEAFVYSVPKTTWKAWFWQKRRHLSVSKYYHPAHKRRLGLLSGTHVLSWLLFVGLLVWSFQGWPQTSFYTWTIVGIFATRGVLQWLILGSISQKLGRVVGWYAIPFFDFLFFIYYAIMAVVLWRYRKRPVRWH